MKVNSLSKSSVFIIIDGNEVELYKCIIFNNSWNFWVERPTQFPYYRWFWDRLGPGTWGPLLQCLHRGKRLLEQQNAKKLSITACMPCWGELWTTRDKKTRNLTAAFEVRSKSRVLRVIPAHSTTKRVGRPPRPSFWADPWTHPYLHPI